MFTVNVLKHSLKTQILERFMLQGVPDMSKPTGKLYKELAPEDGLFVYPEYIQYVLDEAKATFPAPGPGFFSKSNTEEVIKWFTKYFGYSEKLEKELDELYLEWIKGYLE